MAEFMNMTARIEGDEELILALDRIQVWPRLQGKSFLDWLSSNAAFWIRIYAPQGETGELVRNIGKTGVYWHPGGAGGGGVYESMAGVRPPQTLRGPSTYPLSVEKGTANKGRGYIYPRDDRAPASVLATRRPRRQSGEAGGAMSFYFRGDKIFRKRVRGQKPQPFVFAAFHQTSIYTRVRMLTLGREIVRGI